LSAENCLLRRDREGEEVGKGKAKSRSRHEDFNIHLADAKK